MPFDILTLIWIGAVFLLGGTVKGVIGLGLPTIALGLLAATLDIRAAMALLLVPSFATNVWQVASGGHLRELLRRLWPFLGCAAVAVWFGSAALRGTDAGWLAALLGLLVVAYAVLGLTRPAFHLAPGREAVAGPLVGIVNGILTGLTGSFVVPGVLYLQALGLGRDALVQGMGMLFMTSTIALAVALGGHGLLPTSLLGTSALAVVPALIGMSAGRRLRGRLSEAAFRRVFFWALLVLGLYIIGEHALAGWSGR